MQVTSLASGKAQCVSEDLIINLMVGRQTKRWSVKTYSLAEIMDLRCGYVAKPSCRGGSAAVSVADSGIPSAGLVIPRSAAR